MKEDNSVLRRVRKTKKNSDLLFFHRKYWTTLKNDQNNFSAERRFVKLCSAKDRPSSARKLAVASQV